MAFAVSMLAILVAAAAAPPAAPAPAFDAEGYRISAYRSPVPSPPEGVAAVTEAELAALISRDGAILIDVTPAEGGHFDPATGAWRLAAPRFSLPGAAWFPEAGRGRPDPRIARWFMAQVTALARARPDKTLVLFCLADCWMSWNAALRLRRAGFSRIAWFAEGSDGWREAGRPLVEVQPYGKVPKE